MGLGSERVNVMSSVKNVKNLFRLLYVNVWFILTGSYVVLLCRVLDFSLHHTDDNSPGGLPVQNVGIQFLFFSHLINLDVKVNCSFCLSSDFEEHFTKP